MIQQWSRLGVNAGNGRLHVCFVHAMRPNTPTRNLAISMIFTHPDPYQAIITTTFDPGDPR
jgi:hypothetical protein